MNGTGCIDLSWEYGAGSHPGSRHEQQDRWGIFPLARPQGILAVIADGMGGHQEGALGAQTVVDTAQRFVHSAPNALQDNPQAALRQLCREMHEAINRQSATARSTLVMVWLTAAQAYWLNVGDSRLYHFRRGQRLMRTRDHSAVQLLMDLGEIKESQMATHPAQNRLYRCLGGEEPPQADSGSFTAREGDLLVLCSDGVWEHIREVEFWKATRDRHLVTAAEYLAMEAARRGGATADNATLVMLQAKSVAAAKPVSWLQRLAESLSGFFKSP